MTETELIAALADAQRRDAHDVDATPFASLDRAAGYRVQTGVLTALGQTVGMLKTAVHPDGIGAVAPIYAGGVGRAPNFRLPSGNAIGVEVEVGVVLRKALAGGATEASVRDAIDHYFVGVEICGTRYVDRAVAGTMGGLADNMSSFGYVIGPTRATADAIAGLDIKVSFAGRQIYAAPAKHGFGTVLASLIAYANKQGPAYPLAAGTIVTTGSMCGMIPTSGPGHVAAWLGDENVEFDLV